MHGGYNMTKSEDIDEIIATRPVDLLLEVLMDDPAINGKMRAHLEKVSAVNMKYHKAHYTGVPIQAEK